MAQITERLSDEHFLMLQRSLRRKNEGEAAFNFAVDHVKNFAGLGEMDSVNIELGVIIRVVPDATEAAHEQDAGIPCETYRAEGND